MTKLRIMKNTDGDRVYYTLERRWFYLFWTSVYYKYGESPYEYQTVDSVMEDVANFRKTHTKSLVMYV